MLTNRKIPKANSDSIEALKYLVDLITQLPANNPGMGDFIQYGINQVHDSLKKIQKESHHFKTMMEIITFYFHLTYYDSENKLIANKFRNNLRSFLKELGKKYNDGRINPVIDKLTPYSDLLLYLFNCVCNYLLLEFNLNHKIDNDGLLILAQVNLANHEFINSRKNSHDLIDKTARMLSCTLSYNTGLQITKIKDQVKHNLKNYESLFDYKRHLKIQNDLDTYLKSKSELTNDDICFKYCMEIHEHNIFIHQESDNLTAWNLEIQKKMIKIDFAGILDFVVSFKKNSIKTNDSLPFHSLGMNIYTKLITELKYFVVGMKFFLLTKTMDDITIFKDFNEDEKKEFCAFHDGFKQFEEKFNSIDIVKEVVALCEQQQPTIEYKTIPFTPSDKKVDPEKPLIDRVIESFTILIEEYCSLLKKEIAPEMVIARYNDTVSLINQLPIEKEKLIKTIFFAMINQFGANLTNDESKYLAYIHATKELFNYLKTIKQIPEYLLPYAKHIAFLLGKTAWYYAGKFLEIKKEEIPKDKRILDTAVQEKIIREKVLRNKVLTALQVVRDAHFAFHKMDTKSSLINATTLIQYANICYIHEFEEYRHGLIEEHDTKNPLLDACVDRAKFENLREDARKKFLKSGSREEQCALYWFEITHVSIQLTTFSSFKPFMNFDFNELVKFIESLNIKEVIPEFMDSKIYYIPMISMGVNIYFQLIEKTVGLVRNAEAYIEHLLLPLSYAICLDWHEPDFVELHKLLTIKLQILKFQKGLYSLSFVQTGYPLLEYDLILKSNAEQIKTIETKLANMKNKIGNAEKVFNALLKDELDAVHEIKPPRQKRKEFISSATFANEKEDDQAEAVDDKNTKILDEIQVLIHEKNFPRAYAKATVLRDKAKASKDNVNLIKAYYYLAETYEYASHFEEDGDKDFALGHANTNYLACLEVMKDYLTNIHDEVIIKLKSQIEYELQKRGVLTEAKIEIEPETGLSIEPVYSALKIYYPNYVMEIFRKIPNGIEAYLVGSSVRSKNPNDYDIAVNLSMAEIVELFGDQGEIIYSKPPVFSIKKTNQKEIQISPFSSYNTKSSDHEILQHPNGGIIIIHRTRNILDDAKKRLFTIDAVYYDIRKGSFIDPYNGLADIEKHIIRFILDPLFTIQRYRPVIFRSIRMMARHYSIAQSVEKILVNHLDLLMKELPSRIHHEITRTLLEDNHQHVVKLFKQYNIFNHVYGFNTEKSDKLLNLIQTALNNPLIKADKNLLWAVIARTGINLQNYSADELMEQYANLFSPVFSQFKIYGERRELIARVILLTHFKQHHSAQTPLFANFNEDEQRLAKVLLGHETRVAKNGMFQQNGNTDLSSRETTLSSRKIRRNKK